MTPVVSNAFTRSARRGGSSFDRTRMVPLEASFSRGTDGCTLHLSPIRGVDTLRVWTSQSARASRTLVCGCQPRGFIFELARRVALESHDASPGLKVEAPLEILDDAHAVVHDKYLPALFHDLRGIGRSEVESVRLIKVDGPIEPLDVKFIDRAMRRGGSALDGDLRVFAAMHVERDEFVTIQAREERLAMKMLAENFRHYLAAISDVSLEGLDAPPTYQMERLLGVSGRVRVRPIETDVYSTSIDIGVGTDGGTDPVPADQSLIFDRPSGTWHDEP